MIFCVEDDDGVRELMLYALNAAGLPANGFEDGAQLFEALKSELPELIILDIMLPGEDGLSILRRLRSDKRTKALPVIMATAKGTEFDKVIGLDLGADDYLAKPFGMMEMVSRVRAVLRRCSAPSSDTLTLGGIELSCGEHTVSVNGERVALTLKEFELLRLFMLNPRIVFTREQLLATVWDDDFFGETRTVDVHIATLRTKLGPCGKYIETVRGVGYRMEDKA